MGKRITVIPIWTMFCACILAVWCCPDPAIGQETDPEERYRDCLLKVQLRPPEALEVALEWGQEDPRLFYPRHCIAMALFAMGDHERAAQGLAKLAGETDQSPDIQGRLLAQSGEAWLQAGQPKPAIEAFSSAITLTPNNHALRIDLARAYAEAEQYWAALDMLDQVLTDDPNDPDAHVFRASAYRRLEAWDLALADTEKALEIAPHHVDALVERGILKLHGGNVKGAQADFGEALIHGPDSPGAALARQYLDEIDALY